MATMRLRQHIESMARHTGAHPTGNTSLWFMFEDIIVLPDNDVRVLLQSVDTAVLCDALRTASDELKGKLLRLMDASAVQQLASCMENGKPIAFKSVEAAQQSVIDQVYALDDACKISVVESIEKRIDQTPEPDLQCLTSEGFSANAIAGLASGTPAIRNMITRVLSCFTKQSAVFQYIYLSNITDAVEYNLVTALALAMKAKGVQFRIIDPSKGQRGADDCWNVQISMVSEHVSITYLKDLVQAGTSVTRFPKLLQSDVVSLVANAVSAAKDIAQRKDSK